MLDLLLLMVPDHTEDQNQELKHYHITNISAQSMEKDAKKLAERLDLFSSYVTR